MEGSNASLHSVLEDLDFLATIYNGILTQYPRTAHIARAAQEGITMLRKYRNLNRQSTVYLAAIALDPKNKFDYFRTGIQLNEWTEHEATQAMSAVRQVRQEQYKTQPSRPGSGIQRPNLDIEDEFTQWRRARYGVQIGTNILWIYIRMETAC